MATLVFKEMGKFFWEGREKVLSCWLSQFSLAKPKPKVAIAKFVWKMQKNSGIMKSGLDAMPLFLLDDLLKQWFTRSSIEGTTKFCQSASVLII